MPALTPPPKIPGLTPFACSYLKDGKEFAITLYGESEQSVLDNNCDALEGLRVDGVLIGTMDASDILGDDDDA